MIWSSLHPLHLFQAPLSLDRNWRGQRSQEVGVGVGGVGGGISLTLSCHRQNDFCIKMGSDEGHFDVSSVVSDRAKRQCHKLQVLKRGESKWNRTEALPLTNLALYR